LAGRTVFLAGCGRGVASFVYFSVVLLFAGDVFNITPHTDIPLFSFFVPAGVCRLRMWSIAAEPAMVWEKCLNGSRHRLGRWRGNNNSTMACRTAFSYSKPGLRGLQVASGAGVFADSWRKRSGVQYNHALTPCPWSR